MKQKPLHRKGSVRDDERSSMRLFWNEYKRECLEVKSIDEVFERYSQFTKNRDLPSINKYIFRTFIRKNGYSNST